MSSLLLPILLDHANMLRRIHKDKYKDDVPESKSRGSSERPGRFERRGTADSSVTNKKRDKSRTRHFFTRKKSSAS